MIKLSIYVRRVRKFARSQREFNDWIREAMAAAAREWLTRYMKLHFEPKAEVRYQYAARTRGTLRRKGEMARARGEQVRPLVWSGKMREAVLGRSLSSFNIIATATSTKHKVRIKIPIPHPLNPKNAGELVRLTNEELNDLKKFIVAWIKLKAEATTWTQTFVIR